MTKPIKSVSELQKKVLQIRTLKEQTHAEKAAAEEELGKLNFTLSLYQNERDLDEETLLKILKMKERVAELEAFVSGVPAIIQDLERKRVQLLRPGG